MQLLCRLYNAKCTRKGACPSPPLFCPVNPEISKDLKNSVMVHQAYEVLHIWHKGLQLASSARDHATWLAGACNCHLSYYRHPQKMLSLHWLLFGVTSGYQCREAVGFLPIRHLALGTDCQHIMGKCGRMGVRCVSALQGKAVVHS